MKNRSMQTGGQGIRPYFQELMMLQVINKVRLLLLFYISLKDALYDYRYQLSIHFSPKYLIIFL